MGENARALAASTHLWPQRVERMATLYSELVTDRQEPVSGVA
jgi:hypothetical protein